MKKIVSHDVRGPVGLIILDGFGFSNNQTGNAIAEATMPHWKSWWHTEPHTLLAASGTAVGLPDGYIGNSEVGHMTIGAGYPVPSPLYRVNELLESTGLKGNKQLKEALSNLATSKKSLHILGLLSDAGVHSHTDHLYAYIQYALDSGVERIIVHPFLDGRDTEPKIAEQFIEPIEAFCRSHPKVTLGSMHGRYYAMDRDGNLDRTKKSFDVLCLPGKGTNSWQEALNRAYTKYSSEEFLEPIRLNPQSRIEGGDGILFFNFRPDRARQLFTMLSQNREQRPAFCITPTRYSSDSENIVLLEAQMLKHTLLDVIARAGLTSYIIAETEKYAHVTYFVSGGREEKFENEERVLIPSLKKATYALVPEMSARQITEHVLSSLEKNPKDFYLINYANADMVGHSGNFKATIKACEVLDEQLAKLAAAFVNQKAGTLFITADHGNAEEMLSPSGDLLTAHTANPVPLLALGSRIISTQKKANDYKNKSIGIVARLVLEELGLKVPETMI